MTGHKDMYEPEHDIGDCGMCERCTNQGHVGVFLLCYRCLWQYSEEQWILYKAELDAKEKASNEGEGDLHPVQTEET